MRKVHVLDDGRKLVTSSGRRYILFTELRDGTYTVCRRSDNVGRLFAERSGTDVIVDFNAEGGSRVLTQPSTSGQSHRYGGVPRSARPSSPTNNRKA